MKTVLDDGVGRELVLLRATYQLLKQQTETPYVINVLEQSTVWDEARCDGYCLMEEIEELLTERFNIDVNFVEEDCNE